METKIELYMCEDCEKAVSKPFGTDETGTLCESCWDDVLAYGDYLWDCYKDDQLLAEFN